ncbi:CRAL/TRIO domain-containing protein [Cardiosporidium cionae]|uniref:CRAL/TRIO domain-containing protein n=1 Tax=Cardiosporidium cionae TaxID=476202 RepID=A0ABQ7J9B7_9APIC|nr:CRAL/TRIO domain-containing protein [Cardiosporidium cionae]|eukprot:KAF8820560.1 CRAL/TRIO domain-containing protein [Cardiosporidium cionae]
MPDKNCDKLEHFISMNAASFEESTVCDCSGSSSRFEESDTCFDNSLVSNSKAVPTENISSAAIGPPPVTFCLSTMITSQQTLTEWQKKCMYKLKYRLRRLHIGEYTQSSVESYKLNEQNATLSSKVETPTRKKYSKHITIEELFWCNELTIARYLKCNSCDVASSLKQLHKTILWRRRVKPDKILPSAISNQLLNGILIRRGFDFSSRPLIHCRPGPVKGATKMNVVSCLTYTIERALQSLPLDVNEQQLSVVVDCTNYKITQMPSLNSTTEVVSIINEHYPGILHEIFIIDAPSAFFSFWKTARRFFSQFTVQSVKFLRSDKQGDMQELKKKIPLEFLPQKFGGKWVDEYMHDNYWRAEELQFLTHEKQQKFLFSALRFTNEKFAVTV